MAAPAFGAMGALHESTGTLEVVPSSSHASGDYELLCVETQDQAVSLTTAAGFTEHPGSPVSAASGTATVATRLTVFERLWNGTDGSPTLSDPGNHVIAAIISLRHTGAGSWSALSDARSSVSGTGWAAVAEQVEDTSGSWDGITTDTADQLIVGITAHAKPDIAGGTAEMSAITNSNLASITERLDDAAASGNGGWLGIFTAEEATSSQAIGATTYTKATASYKAHLLVAVRNAAPAAAVTFEASIAGTGAVAVDFVRTQTFATAIAGLGAVTTDFVRDKRVLEAAIVGSGSLATDLAVQIALEAAIAGTGTVVADLSKVVLLDAQIEGTSAVVTDFVRQVGLAAILAGQGAVGASLVQQLSFETAIAGLAAVVPSQLAVQVGMETVIQGVSQVVADFVRTPLALEALIAGNGTLVVDITVTTPGGEVLVVRTLLGVGL